MGQIQTTIYRCDQCGNEVSYENMMPGTPPGWYQLIQSGAAMMGGPSTAGLLFDKMECIRDYSKDKAPEAPSGS